VNDVERIPETSPKLPSAVLQPLRSKAKIRAMSLQNAEAWETIGGLIVLLVGSVMAYPSGTVVGLTLWF